MVASSAEAITYDGPTSPRNRSEPGASPVEIRHASTPSLPSVPTTWAAKTSSRARRSPKRCTSGNRPTMAKPIHIQGVASDTNADAMRVPTGSVRRFTRFVAVEAMKDLWSDGSSPYAYTEETTQSAMMKGRGGGGRRGGGGARGAGAGGRGGGGRPRRRRAAGT